MITCAAEPAGGGGASEADRTGQQSPDGSMSTEE
jgi:hypothetical protein